MSTIAAPQKRRRSRRPVRPAAAPRRRVEPRSRAAATGRHTPALVYVLLTLIVASLGLVITLRVSTGRTNIEVGSIEQQVRKLDADAANARANAAAALPRARVEAFAVQTGMIEAPADSLREMRRVR